MSGKQQESDNTEHKISFNAAIIKNKTPYSFIGNNCLSKSQKGFVRSGIRTHAQRTGLRPERSALDHSAILTLALYII